MFFVRFDDWAKVASDNDVQLAREIAGHFAGFTDSPVGLYNGIAFQCMSRAASSIDEVHRVLQEQAEGNALILRCIEKVTAFNSAALPRAVLDDPREFHRMVEAGKILPVERLKIRYGVVPIIKVFLKEPAIAR